MFDGQRMMGNQKPLPPEVMKKAVRGLSYVSHPLRLRILEYLDVYGSSSVSAITKGVREEQVIVSQSLRKLRDADLVETKRRGIFIYYDICEEYPASLFVCLRKLYGYMTDSFLFLKDGVKAVLPADYTMMAANQIKLFANYDKMRILEYLTINGESCVCDIVEGIGYELGKHIAGLINIFNPELVIVGGILSLTGDYLIQPVRTAIRKHSLNLVNKDTIVAASQLKERAGMVGACMLARSRIFEDAL